MPIVLVQWPVVGRPAWCHILAEKKVSTLSPNPFANLPVSRIKCDIYFLTSHLNFRREMNAEDLTCSICLGFVLKYLFPGFKI